MRRGSCTCDNGYDHGGVRLSDRPAVTRPGPTHARRFPGYRKQIKQRPRTLRTQLHKSDTHKKSTACLVRGVIFGNLRVACHHQRMNWAKDATAAIGARRMRGKDSLARHQPLLRRVRRGEPPHGFCPPPCSAILNLSLVF
jgi:hypothetical protein